MMTDAPTPDASTLDDPEAGDAAARNEAEAAVRAWEAAGTTVTAATPGGTFDVFVQDVAARTDAGKDPILVLHGFPSCSFDWRLVLPQLSADRRVVLPDLIGFGLSAKPDLRYGIRLYADVVAAVAAELGLERVALVTHDVGDSVGGELLARDLDGELGFSVTERVITNGSIYLELVHFTDGQKLLLSLPDERLDAIGRDGGESYRNALAATFGPGHTVPDAELHALWLMMDRHHGSALLPRTIRYIEDRRAEEGRYTGAIESHASPLAIVWGDADPVADHAMAVRLAARRPEAPFTTLEGTGHYPMLEAPTEFAAAVVAGLR
jgi:pimeloyl-ACP methyl ester carboxylesterase